MDNIQATNENVETENRDFFISLDKDNGPSFDICATDFSRPVIEKNMNGI